MRGSTWETVESMGNKKEEKQDEGGRNEFTVTFFQGEERSAPTRHVWRVEIGLYQSGQHTSRYCGGASHQKFFVPFSIEAFDNQR